jgi:hypothetical protein
MSIEIYHHRNLYLPIQNYPNLFQILIFNQIIILIYFKINRYFSPNN